MRRRRRKRIDGGARVKLPAATQVNERWSMDFMGDTFADGRTFRTLNIVDDFSRESPAIEVDRRSPELAWYGCSIGSPSPAVCPR